jgi:hypothetical protein
MVFSQIEFKLKGTTTGVEMPFYKKYDKISFALFWLQYLTLHEEHFLNDLLKSYFL